MSATRELMAALIGGGMDAVDAAALVARAGAEMNTGGPSKAALRTRKWRASKPSQTVTGDAPVTPPDTPSQTVTERHKPSPCDAKQIPPLILSSFTEKDSEQKKESKRGGRTSKRHPLPADWHPPPRSQSIASELGLSIPPIEARFRDYLASTGRTYADYDAGFCNFVRNTPKFQGPQSRMAAHGKRSLSDEADRRIARAEEQDRTLDLGPADYFDAGFEVIQGSRR